MEVAWKFWYSPKHAEHLASLRYTLPWGHALPTAVANGMATRYTAASLPDASEPFVGALERFPDYRVLGIGRGF